MSLLAGQCRLMATRAFSTTARATRQVQHSLPFLQLTIVRNTRATTFSTVNIQSNSSVHAGPGRQHWQKPFRGEHSGQVQADQGEAENF